MATVQPTHRDPTQRLAIHLWRRDEGWLEVGRMEGGDATSIIDLTAPPGHWPMLAWKVGVKDGRGGMGFRAVTGSMEGTGDQPSVVIDPSVTSISPLHLIHADSVRQLWLVEHQAGERRTREVRFVEVVDGQAEVIASFPHRYLTRIGVASENGRVIVAGGIRLSDGSAVVSRIMRFTAYCPFSP